MRQSFKIPVKINKALLVGIVTEDVVSAQGVVNNNDMLVYKNDAASDRFFLSKLVIEPFIGFVEYGTFQASDMIDYNGKTNYDTYGLPQTVKVLLETNTGMTVTELNVDWDYQAVLNVMSITGGMYDQSKTNTIVRANVYKDVDGNGTPINVQTSRVSVEVKNRTIRNYKVSYDTAQKLAPYPEAGDLDRNRVVYDGNQLYVKVRGSGRIICADEMQANLAIYENTYYKYYPMTAAEVDASTFETLDDIIYTTRNKIGTESTYELLVNPYTLKNAMFEETFQANPTSMTYSEVLTDKNGDYNDDFTYFRYVKALCADGYEVTYKLTSDNYSMFDKSTKRSTSTTNLYTGRSISMNLTVGEDVLYEKERKNNKKLPAMTRVAASDSYGLVVAPRTLDNDGNYAVEEDEDGVSRNVFRSNIDVRILNMTYEAGSGLPKDIYYVDVYGIIETFDRILKYEEKTIESGKNTILGKDSENYFWGDDYIGSVTNIAGYTFGEISYDGADAAKNRYDIVSVKSNGAGGVNVTLKNASGSTNGKKISYNGGVGRLAATFGSKSEIQAGGTQVFYIPIVYVDRTVEEILFKTDKISGTTAPFYNEEKNMFEFDPFVEYVNNPEGFVYDEVEGKYQQGFLRYGQYGATLKFKQTAIDEVLNLTVRTKQYDLASQVLAEYIGLTFTDANLTIKYTGGTFDVFAIVSNRGADSAFSRQRITYKAKFISRIVGVNDDIPHGVVDTDESDKQWYGKVIYYHKNKINNKYYQIYGGITTNLFKDGAGGVMVKKTIRISDTETEDVWCVDENALNKALKVYDYIGQLNVGGLIADSLFKSQIQTFYVYSQGTGDPIQFTYGQYAMPQNVARKIGSKTANMTLSLTNAEITGEGEDGETYNNGVMMRFILDPSYGINYRGSGVKFIMTIPGFAAGRNEQQTLTVTVSTKEQYIPLVVPTYSANGKHIVEPVYSTEEGYESSLTHLWVRDLLDSEKGALTGTLTIAIDASHKINLDLYGYAWMTYFKSVIEKRSPGQSDYEIIGSTLYLTDNSFGSNAAASGYDKMYVLSYNTANGVMTIENPYYFIVDGGMAMPDYVMVIAGTKALQEEYNNALKVYGGTSVQGFNNREKSTFSEWLTDWLFNTSNDPDEQGHLVRKVGQAYEENAKLDTYAKYTRRTVTRALNANWSGASQNKVTVYFNATAHNSTFKMTMDDQSVAVPFTVVPWLSGGNENPVTLFRSTNEYGPEDIIMFPLVSINKRLGDVVVKEFIYPQVEVLDQLEVYDTVSNKSPKFVSDSGDGNIYGYRMYYTIGGKNYYVDITDIYGGGTFRNNYNKWYFGNVQFGVGTTQYATMTLGGKGGQTIRWEFPNLSTRKEVNNNVPTLVAITKGDSGVYELPPNYIARYGSGDDDKTPSNVYIPITYTTPVSASNSSTAKKADNQVWYPDGNGEYSEKTEGKSKTYKRGSQENTIGAPVLRTSVRLKNTYTLYTNADVSSSATVQGLEYAMEPVNDGETDVYCVNSEQVAKMHWTIGGRCAYPASLDGIGGDIYVSIYGDKVPMFFDKTTVATYDDWKDYLKTWSNKKQNKTINDGYFRLVRPDAESTNDVDVFSYTNTGAPSVPSTYTYSGMDTSSEKKMTKTGSTYNNDNAIINIKIDRNTKFDVRYLPLLKVEYNWDGQSETVNPWREYEYATLFSVGGVEIPHPMRLPFAIWAGIFGNRDSKEGQYYTSIIIPWQDAVVTKANGDPVQDGIAGIDTSDLTNRYYLTCSFPLGSTYNMRVKVQITIKK